MIIQIPKHHSDDQSTMNELNFIINNPLNILGVRRAEVALPHFTYRAIKNPLLTNDKEVERWITENLNGRYWIGKKMVVENNQNVKYIKCIGFESEKDAFTFALLCPHLK